MLICVSYENRNQASPRFGLADVGNDGNEDDDFTRVEYDDTSPKGNLVMAKEIDMFKSMRPTALKGVKSPLLPRTRLLSSVESPNKASDAPSFFTDGQQISEGDMSFLMSDNGTKRVKYADLLLSPTRFVQRKFRAGGTSGSIFCLVAATLGSGTISFAYAIEQNGIVFGIILIVLGALISYYTGMLLVKVSIRTQCNRYEDFA